MEERFRTSVDSVEPGGEKGLDARLTLVGVGPDIDYLLYLRNMLNLNDAVEMPGKLNYEQILELFRSAHAYIQSSVAEGLSNSLVEALANGLPVFATDVGGTREVVEDGITDSVTAFGTRELVGKTQAGA